MRLYLLPSFKFNRVTDITADFLSEHGIDLLLLDVDNTLAPYKTITVETEVAAWAQDIKNSGVTLFLVSNNKGDRPEIFSRALSVPYIKRAGKPKTRGVMSAMENAGGTRRNTALVGDQIYTDMLCAGLANITGILVEPIKFTNIFLALRYGLELPFRHQTGKKRE